MKLISISSNQPSFHEIVFNDCFNIVVGNQVSPHGENDGNTYNGVGKSLIIHLIHFCLGSNKIDAFSQKLPNWEFTLSFENEGQTYTATRNTTKQSEIIFCGEAISLSAMREKMLNLCFGLSTTPNHMTWTTLFSRFARRYRSCYAAFDAFTPKESDYCKLLNNCYLLGIDTDLIVQKKELRDRQSAAKATESAIKKDPLFRQYYLGSFDPSLDFTSLAAQISELESQIAAFKVSNNYHDLEKEADDKSYQKKLLENRRVLISNRIKSIEASLTESTNVTEEKLLSVYSAANIEVPEMVKKSLDEVLSFHSNLLSTRNSRLKKDLISHKAELNQIDEEISALGARMDELLDFLNSHGALEEYVALTKQLSSLQNKLNRIQEYQKILKAYRDAELDIQADLIKGARATDDYLEAESTLFSDLRTRYWNYAQQFYPKKRSGLIVKNNSAENMLRYTLDAHIEDDSSDGVNEVRMFCFDLLLLTEKKGNIRFLAHDSRLFANMDPRQRATLFRLAYNTCKTENLQYFCSINEDSLMSFEPLMTPPEFEQIITKNVILKLNDDSPQSKLLGVQVDIDLEGRGNSFDAFN